jgi:hypothetical protein
MTEPKQSRRPRPKGDDPTDVEDLLSLMRDGESLWLWRRSPDGQKWVFIEGRDPEAMRAVGVRESTRQRTGGGEYKARIRRPNGQWGEQRAFSIDGPPRSVPTDTPAVAAAVAAHADARSGMPEWIGKILVPIGAALGAGIVDKILSGPKTDPLILELIKRTGRGEAIDAVELQKLVLDAETRGETRGRQLGELTAATERVTGGGGDSLVSVMREAAPIFSNLLQHRSPQLAPAIPQSSPAMPPTAAAAAPASDIVPAWLRPFMNFKPWIISAADNGHDPRPMGDMVIVNARDEMWTAIVEAESAGRLDSDFFAAVPEMRNTPERLEFAFALLGHIREEVAHQSSTASKTTPTAATGAS